MEIKQCARSTRIKQVLNLGFKLVIIFLYESLILAQNERWQRGLGMQVERDPMK